jgi:6-pyruvoyltetrahydropterin/6-carboxytetrahydropterin synthase
VTRHAGEPPNEQTAEAQVMYLTISKRFEFSASHRYYNKQWSEDRNRAVFGKAAGTSHGFGQNYTAFFVFHGEPDRRTGMVINVSTIKERIKALLDRRYDHKYLNVDTSPFDDIQPTPENIARELLKEITPLFAGDEARPVVCHLTETPGREATAYADGTVESHFHLEFSAARRTFSPHLNDQENIRLFGVAAAPGGHGHGYRLRVTIGGDVNADSGMILPDQEVQAVLGDLRDMLDYRNLNTDIPDLRGMPITTENLSRYIWSKLRGSLPLRRVRLHEKADFFAEYHGRNRFFMGIESSFNAAHRLHSPLLSDAENRSTYEKCNNPGGHGHLYRVEATIAGKLDERSGTLAPLDQLFSGLRASLSPWDYKHLDLDTDDFTGKPSTSENMLKILWPRVNDNVGGSLHRLRLWETPNNRFALRLAVDAENRQTESE